MVVAISSADSVRISLTFQTASCNSILAGCRLRDFPVFWGLSPRVSSFSELLNYLWWKRVSLVPRLCGYF